MKSILAKPAVVLTVIIVATSVAVLGIAFGSRGEVPEWLRRKLEFEAKYEEYVTEQSTKCAREVATLEKKRAEAPKDEKGNPVLQEEYAPKFETVAPRDRVFVVRENTTDYLPSALRDELDITSTAYAPYDILIAASRKEDKAAAIIYDFQSSPDSYGFEELVFRLPGKGPIVLESLVEDNNVVTFRWGSEGIGYFDLRTKSVAFEEYHAP